MAQPLRIHGQPCRSAHFRERVRLLASTTFRGALCLDLGFASQLDAVSVCVIRV